MTDYSSLFDGIGIWLACFFTLAAFSFLYRDNPIYKIVEHVYIGTAAGYGFYLAFWSTIYPNFFKHVTEGMHKISAGDSSAWITQWRWAALLLGLLVLARLAPKWSWISRWPMGLIAGAFAGLNLVGLAQANLTDQINGTFMALAAWQPGPDGTLQLMPFFPTDKPGTPTIFNHLILVAGVISVLTYFFFSTAQKGVFHKVGQVGICFVMLTFGATYGSIVLARISLLIGRVQLLSDANRSSLGYPPIVCAAIVIGVLIVWRLKYFKPPEAEKTEE